MKSKIQKNKEKSKCKCNCCGKKSTRKKFQKECEKNIIDGNKEDTIMVMEGEKKVTKIIKVKGMKFNLAVTGGKQGSKVLHKIKILMLRSNNNLQKGKLEDLKLKKINIQKKNNNSCGCFGHSKSKTSNIESIGDDKTSPIPKSMCKIDSISSVKPTEDGIESSTNNLSTNNLKTEKK